MEYGLSPAISLELSTNGARIAAGMADWLKMTIRISFANERLDNPLSLLKQQRESGKQAEEMSYTAVR